MLADAEDVKAGLIGEFDLAQQAVHALYGCDDDAGDGIGGGGGEAVEAYLHGKTPWLL